MPVPPMTPEELQRIIEYFSIQKPGPALIGPARTSLKPNLYPGGKFANGLFQPNTAPAQVGSGILVDPVTGQDINPPASTVQNIPLRQRENFNPQTPTGPQTISSPPISQPVSPQVSQSPKPYFSDLSNIPTQQDQPSASQDIKEILAAQGGPGGPAQGAVTPEKTNADDREKRLRRMEAFRGIAEGLGSIGTGFERASLIRAGLNPSLAQPYVAETIRGRIDREEDRISPQDKEAFAKIGIDIPEGVTYSKLKMVSPYFGMPLRKQALDLSARRLLMQERGLDIGEKRLGMLSPTDTRAIAGIEASKDILEDIEELYDSQKETLGPIASRLMSIQGKVLGSGAPEFAALESKLVRFGYQYAAAVHGLRASEKEIAQLLNSMGQTIDTPERFHMKIEEMKRELEQRKQALLEASEKSGKNISGFASDQQTKTTPGTSEGARFSSFIDEDGTIYDVPNDKVTRFKSSHPNAREYNNAK